MVKLEQVIPISTFLFFPDIAADVQRIQEQEMLSNRTVTLHPHKLQPVCVPTLVVCCSAFIPGALQHPAFRILKLVHVYFTTGGTAA